MKRRQYLVVLEKDPDTDWGAWVPDLPGCVSTGKTLDSALRRIEGAIRFHLEGMEEEGLPIPPPRKRVVRPKNTTTHIEFFATVQVAA